MAAFEIRLKHQHFAVYTLSQSKTDAMTYFLAGLLLAGAGRQAANNASLVTCPLLITVTAINSIGHCNSERIRSMLAL